MVRPLILATLAVLVASATAPASSVRRAIRRVPQDFATIKDAVQAAESGDTVLISRGTYGGGVTVAKSITLASTFLLSGDPRDISETILNTGSPILLVTANEVKIHGLTFQGGSKAVVATGQGILVANSRFVRNGGDQMSFERSSGTVRDCHFEQAGDDGIDVDGSAGDITLENNTILDPRDDGVEERLFAYAGEKTHRITYRNNFISGAREDGIQLIDYPGASNRVLRIERNTILRSAMAGIGSMPGGNTRENYGGADLAEKVLIVNNTIVGNNHGITGGDRMLVMNNIISGSSAVALKRVAQGSLITHNCLWNNGTETSESVAASHTVRADPMLDAASHPAEAGPCVNAGAASVVWGGETVSAPATVREAPDIGAVEAGGIGLPAVTVEAEDAEAGEPSNNGLFRIRRAGSVASPLTVKYTVGGTATSGADYAALSGMVTIPAGSGSAMVTVIPVDDRAVESAESVVLTLSAGPAHSVGTPSSATVTIADDDSTLPVVTLKATDAEAKERGLDPAVFTVTRTGSTAGALVVTVVIAGDATNGVDYREIGTTVTIPAGSATATILILPIDDALAEAEEVDLTLAASPTYTVGAPGGASITITDDD